MAITLRKFKLLALHCVTACSRSRSPVRVAYVRCFMMRRRRTLRDLLGRHGERFRESSSDALEKRGLLLSHTLKDLFLSSPPMEEEEEEEERGGLGRGGDRGISVLRAGFMARRRPRRVLRARLLRRAWRPVLVTIPE